MLGSQLMKVHRSPFLFRLSRGFVFAGAGLVLALLLAIQVKWLSCYSLGYDDSQNSLLAKNLARGQGYVSLYGWTYPDGYYSVRNPFPYDITTGPALIVPAALFIRIFGNQYWAPGLTVVVLSLVLLLACLPL
jgi:hypothetical protein